MATVPTYDNLKVAPGAAPANSFATPEFHNYAADQAQQMGRSMSNAGAHLTAIAIDAQNEANLTAAKDIDTQALSKISGALYDPNKGYLVKQGKDAIDGYNDTENSLKDIRQSMIASIGSDAVRKLAEPAINARLQQAMETMNRHAATESLRYGVQTSDSRAIGSLQDAAFNYTDDNRFVTAVQVAHDEAITQGKLQGWDESTIKLKAQSYTDTAFKMRFDAWSVKDPVAAFANFQKNAELISPLQRDNISRQLFQHAAPVLAQQLNETGGSGVLNGPGDGLPRGLRNNNPGNIMQGATKWEGEVSGHDPRYASFSSPEAGIRAMGKNLITYQDKYNLRTVEGIVSRWAPATENETGTYVATVAKALGVKPDAEIDLHNADTLAKITKAMIKVENGVQPYTDQQITAGLNAATGVAPLTASPSSIPARRDPSTATGIALIDGLPADQKLHVFQLAKSQAQQDMAVARENLRTKVQDATAEYLANGYASNPPSEADFIRAHGQADGVRQYQAFQGTAALGQTLQQVKNLPSTALAELVKTSKPAPGDGFAARQANYTILNHAVDTVIKARNEDSVAYALTNGAYGIQPIKSISDPKLMAQELTKRAAAAPQMATDYGTPLQLLTKSEASTLSSTLKAAPVEQQKQYLATMAKRINDMGLFKSTMQAIAPDSPTTAVAGIYQARGLRTTDSRDVADLILRGQAILTPNTKTDGSDHQGGRSLIKMPEEKLMLSDWNSVTGDAFKGREQSSDLFQQTAKAIYAAKSAEAGDYSGELDSKRWKQSINLATGGIESHNGSKVVLPYGYGYDRFQDELKVQAERIVKDGGALNTTVREMMRLPVESVGDGRYMFRRGAGYLVNKDGRPVVADLSGGR